VLKEYLTPVRDTFNTRDLAREPSLQADIALDTIDIPMNKKHKGITMIYPKVSKEEFPDVYRSIDQLIKTTKKEFSELVKDEPVRYFKDYDRYEGWSMGMGPVSLYQTEKVISYAVEDGRGYTGMPSGFEYNIINYDLEKKKEIELGDYFILNTPADTAYLEGIIGRAMNREFSIKQRTEYLGQINFSFDDFYVYFYFDKYDILGFGISSIKKKYIIDHINPAYR
jgi:hypothetical protein